MAISPHFFSFPGVLYRNVVTRQRPTAGMSQVQLQQFGCQYLCSMAQAMPDVREEILQNGGIRPLISAMNNYPQDEKGVGSVGNR